MYKLISKLIQFYIFINKLNYLLYDLILIDTMCDNPLHWIPQGSYRKKQRKICEKDKKCINPCTCLIACPTLCTAPNGTHCCCCKYVDDPQKCRLETQHWMTTINVFSTHQCSCCRHGIKCKCYSEPEEQDNKRAMNGHGCYCAEGTHDLAKYGCSIQHSTAMIGTLFDLLAYLPE